MAGVRKADAPIAQEPFPMSEQEFPTHEAAAKTALAIYRFYGGTYSVDEQYSGEGCSTERPKTLTGVWGVLLLQQNRLRELRRALLFGHARLREEGRKAMKPV
jgi:hypothetical protein